MSWFRARTSVVAATLCLALFVSSTGGGCVSTAHAAGADVHTDQVCFAVHNEGDPAASSVYGVRYYMDEPGPQTRAIILVHGYSVSHAFWDLRSDWSVARRLAGAGYLVIAYDRLGYAKSPYTRPAGGYSLTFSGQREMLHQVVQQVKTGSYALSENGRCSLPLGPGVGLASPSVILIGHSGGGLMVSGYPGIYHDVAAVVQAGWSNQGLSTAGSAYVGRVLASQVAMGNDYINLFPTPDDCKAALLYMPQVLPTLLPQFCESSFVSAPAGELIAIHRTVTESLAAITRVGPGLPVLLAYEEPDFFFDRDKNAAETAYWTTHCACDVSSWTQADTGHALVAHRSMPRFVAEVVTWLGSRGLGLSSSSASLSS